MLFGAQDKKDFYEGEWYNGTIHGTGKMVWKDGSVYEGEFISGRKEGNGKFIFPNQNYYQGLWFGGKQNGYGKLYNKDDKEIKKGIWKDGVFTGDFSDDIVKEEDKAVQSKISESRIKA